MIKHDKIEILKPYLNYRGEKVELNHTSYFYKDKLVRLEKRSKLNNIEYIKEIRGNKEYTFYFYLNGNIVSKELKKINNKRSSVYKTYKEDKTPYIKKLNNINLNNYI